MKNEAYRIIRATSREPDRVLISKAKRQIFYIKTLTVSIKIINLDIYDTLWH